MNSGKNWSIFVYKQIYTQYCYELCHCRGKILNNLLTKNLTVLTLIRSQGSFLIFRQCRLRSWSSPGPVSHLGRWCQTKPEGSKLGKEDYFKTHNTATWINSFVLFRISSENEMTSLSLYQSVSFRLYRSSCQVSSEYPDLMTLCTRGSPEQIVSVVIIFISSLLLMWWWKEAQDKNYRWKHSVKVINSSYSLFYNTCSLYQ